jgi:lactose/L-arabinose transport system permease protein
MAQQVPLSRPSPASPEPIHTRPRNTWRRMWKARWGYIFVAPFFILFLIFGIYPLVSSFILSFTNWNGRGPIEFAGLVNYRLLLTDTVFWQSMLNGVILFFMYVPLMTLFALILAVLLNSKRVRGFQFFRTLLFLPYITNMVAAGYTFQMLLGQQYGLFNIFLGVFNIPPVPWLDSIWGARVSLCLLVVWAWLGYNMVIMLAGLQTIPSELAEAAAIDGATPIQAFFYVTIPLMQPVILFCVVLSTMGSFGFFTELVSLFPGTGGTGPLNSTITPILSIFNQAFSNFRLGYASAMAYVYFAFIFVLTLFQIRRFGKLED